MIEEIEIPLSKFKLGLIVLGALAFVLAGFVLAFNPNELVSNKYESTIFMKFMGFLSVIFFGAALVLSSKKILDTSPGLVINNKGISDNSTVSSVGLIEWEDIIDVRIIEISSNKMLLLEVRQFQKYIDQVDNKLAKITLKANHKIYGSPIIIPTNTLKIKVNDLEIKVREALKQREKKPL